MTPDPAPEVAAPPFAPRFCTRCGAPWDPALPDCAPCAVAHARTQLPPQPATGIATLPAALALYFVFLASSATSIAVLSNSHIDAISVEFADLAFVTPLIIVWCVAARRDVLPLLRNPARLPWYLAAVAAAGLTFLAAHAAVAALKSLFSVPEISYVAPYLRAGYSWPFIIAINSLYPAVFEELAFRGVILAAVRRVMSDRDAVLVSASLFMIIHLSVPSFPHLLLIGIALGFLRLRTASLYPGMLLHFTHNLLVVLYQGLTTLQRHGITHLQHHP